MFLLYIIIRARCISCMTCIICNRSIQYYGCMMHACMDWMQRCSVKSKKSNMKKKKNSFATALEILFFLSHYMCIQSCMCRTQEKILSSLVKTILPEPKLHVLQVILSQHEIVGTAQGRERNFRKEII